MTNSGAVQLTKVQQEYTSSQHRYTVKTTEVINNISTNHWTDNKSNVRHRIKPTKDV